MDLDLPQLHAFALELADEADAIAMRAFGGPVPAVTKADGTPVTEADEAIERTLRQRLRAAYPAHAILGEEGGGALRDDAPTWVIDPIDATKNFMRGVPVFATLVSLVVDGHAVVGVASAPALGARWDARRGGGARLNGRPVGVSGIASLADAHVVHGDADRFRPVPALWNLFGTLHDEAWRVRGFGDFWSHVLVAQGSAEVAVERELAAWDVAALECIVTEAGGRVTDFRGGPVLRPTPGPNGVLSSNGALHDVLLARLSAALED